MHNIIKTEEDADILRSHGILVSDHKSNIEVVEMFKDLSQNVHQNYELKNGYYADLYKDLETFCAVPHRKWRAYLVKNYFSYPLSFIKLLYHLLLLLFIIIRAIASISSNKK